MPSRTESRMPAMNGILTLRQAAQYLKIAVSTLYGLVNQRKIPGFKVGGQWRFRKATLDNWFEEGGTHRGPRVLVVDDEEKVLRAFEQMPFLAPYGVVTAKRGEEAIERVTRGNFELIFLEVRMPGVSGVEVFKVIKNFLPRAKVVVFTGLLDGDLIRQALELGPLMLLRKPVSLEDLEKVVGDVFGRR